MSFPSEVPEKWMCTHVRAGWGNMVGAASMKFEEPFSNEKQISKRGLVHVFFLFIRRTREILLILMHDKYRIFYFLFFVNLYEYFSVINSLSFFVYRIVIGGKKRLSFDDPDIYMTRHTVARTTVEFEYSKIILTYRGTIVKENEIYFRILIYSLYIIILSNSNTKSHL